MFWKMFAGSAVWIIAIQLGTAADIGTADEAAIRRLISAFELAENKHDGKGIADLFLPGSPDRQAVSKRVASGNTGWTERSPMRFRVDSLHAIHPEIALVDTTATWYQSGLLATSSQQMLVLMKDHGEWKISAYRRTCKTGR